MDYIYIIIFRQFSLKLSIVTVKLNINFLIYNAIKKMGFSRDIHERKRIAYQSKANQKVHWPLKEISSTKDSPASGSKDSPASGSPRSTRIPNLIKRVWWIAPSSPGLNTLDFYLVHSLSLCNPKQKCCNSKAKFNSTSMGQNSNRYIEIWQILKRN